jgi:taurine dioxygenase
MGEAFEIRPLTPCIGAEVRGLDLRNTPGAVLEGELERALLEHLVLFFRDQDLSPAQQLAFGRCFGKVSLPPIAQPHPDEPDLMVFDQTEPSGAGADTWHTDAIWIEKPPKISMLRAVQLPAQGGDTCFANMYDAYDDLSMQHRYPPVHHPVVRTHPDTGRKALYITGNSTTEILGLSPKESTLLLEFLLDHVQSPQYQCRFRWEPHSLALWDNRCTLHFGVPDYHERRVMYRLCVEGDAPA